MSSWNGSPPRTEMQGWTPWIKAPGYDFSSKLYDYMSGMIGQPAPRYGGFGRMQGMAAQQNPFASQVTDLAGRYMNMGMPTVFGQAMGTLGRFANPSFANPVERIGQGYPNYMGYKPPQLPQQPPQGTPFQWPPQQG